MKKTKRLNSFNVGNTLSAGELSKIIEGLPKDFSVVLKCGGKNFRLGFWSNPKDKLILHGYR